MWYGESVWVLAQAAGGISQPCLLGNLKCGDTYRCKNAAIGLLVQIYLNQYSSIVVLLYSLALDVNMFNVLKRRIGPGIEVIS